MKLIVFILLLLSHNAVAIKLNLKQIACNLTNLTAEECASLEDRAREKLREDLPKVSLEKYADGVADATAFSVQGQGSEYAENFKTAIVKPSLGIAVDGKLSQLETNPEEAAGIGVGTAVTVGANLKNLDASKVGPIILSRLDVFVSGALYDIRQDFDDVDTDGTLTSAGVFGRYRLIKDEDYLPWHMLDWGGIHIHTGLQYSKISLEASQSFASETFRDGLLEGKFNGGTATLSLDAYSWSVPVEISTYFRIAYILTVYGGFGADFVTGDSNIGLSASGSASGGLSIIDDDLQLAFDADRDVDGTPRSSHFRTFLGLQLNIPYFRVFVHANKAIDSNLVGAHAGVKFVF